MLQEVACEVKTVRKQNSLCPGIIYGHELRYNHLPPTVSKISKDWSPQKQDYLVRGSGSVTLKSLRLVQKNQ